MFQLSDSDQPFLNGNKFASVYSFQLHGKSKPLTRIEFLKNFLSDKKVIHFGCVDHLPLVEHRRKSGQWVHEILERVCTRVAGVDIVQEGIDYMTNAGFEAYNANVVTEPIPVAITSTKWDYLLAGEVLEHIGNPVQFLSAIREKYSVCTEKIIITVPNAFAWTNFRSALRDEEKINTDHRFWFTGYTLAKVATDAGIQVESLNFCQDAVPPFFSMKRILVNNKPNFRDRLVLIGKL